MKWVKLRILTSQDRGEVKAAEVRAVNFSGERGTVVEGDQKNSILDSLGWCVCSLKNILNILIIYPKNEKDIS